MCINTYGYITISLVSEAIDTGRYTECSQICNGSELSRHVGKLRPPPYSVEVIATIDPKTSTWIRRVSLTTINLTWSSPNPTANVCWNGRYFW